MRQLALVALLSLLLTCSPTESPIEPPVEAPTPVVTLHATPHLEADQRRATEWGISLWLSQNIRMAAEAHGIPLAIAFALVDAESDFTIRAESWAGARGLIQVMPATGLMHCGLTPDGLYVPHLNLNCGYSYLAMMYSHFGDWRLALMAYHRGPTRLTYELDRGFGHGISERYSDGILSAAVQD